MSAHERPISPHLQIYRWQITMVMSILHRITGIALGVGTIVLVYWLVAAAAGPKYFNTAQAIMGSIPGRIVLFGFTACLVYHLLNGIRHLAWDTGAGMEIPQFYRSGWLVAVLTVFLTLAIWIAGYAVAGNWFGAEAG